MDEDEKDSIFGTLGRYAAHGPEGAANLTQAFKPGRPSEHAVGVLYHAPWEAPFDGFAEHSRRCARALAMTGCPVHLRSLTPHMAAGSETYEHALELAYGDLAHASIGRYSVQIHQVVPNPELLFGLVRHRYLNDDELRSVNHMRVLSTVWERTPIPEGAIDAMNRVGQNWVACQQNADSLVEWGVTTPVFVVPVPYFENDPLLKLRSRKRKPGPPRFYHIGKWEPRKAQVEILGAFMRAFRPGEAELYLKTSEFASSLPDYPEPVAALHGWLTDPEVKAQGWTLQNVEASIHVFMKKISSDQLTALHGLCDVYVTLSRGEGFDMPAFDAKLAGNLMVYTPSGGPQDFAHPVDYLVPEVGRVPCHPFYKWGETATYLDFDLADASKAMREAYEEVEFSGARAGRSGGRPITEAHHLAKFRAGTIGQNMLSHLRELTDEVY